MAHRRQVSGESDEPGLVDARGVDAGDEKEDPPEVRRGKYLRAGSVPERHGTLSRSSVTSCASQSATVLAAPCMPAARTTNAAP